MKRFIAFLIFFNVMVASAYHFQLFDFPKGLNLTSTTEQTGLVEPSITLVSERVTPVEVAIAPVLEEVEAVEVQVCYEIDPVAEDQVKTLLAELKDVDLPLSESLYQHNEITSHWVYIPALESLTEARSLHVKIRELGVEDVYVIEGGKNKNSISLGIYRDHEAALSRVKWFAKKGIDVDIVPRYKSYSFYRVDVGPITLKQSEIFVAILEEKFSLLKYQKKSCK